MLEGRGEGLARGDARFDAAPRPGWEVTTMSSVTQQRTIPEAIRSLSGMESPDYSDLFTVRLKGAADASPEQWARTAVEDVAGRRMEDRRSRRKVDQTRGVVLVPDCSSRDPSG